MPSVTVHIILVAHVSLCLALPLMKICVQGLEELNISSVVINHDSTASSVLHKLGANARDGVVLLPHSIPPPAWLTTLLDALPVQSSALSPRERATADETRALYVEFAADLMRVRADARVLRAAITGAGHQALLGDIEAELLYLRARRDRPRHTFELGVNCGWSTFWLLSAARDNGDVTARVHSFDLHDCARRMFVDDERARVLI